MLRLSSAAWSYLVWAQLSGGIFDLYEIVPGFVFGLLAIVVVSLLTLSHRPGSD